MERMKQIADVSAEILRENFLKDATAVLISLIQQPQQIIENISIAIEFVLRKAGEQQKAQKKGPVAYITFSFLQSNLFLNNYAFQVDAWDEQFYLDSSEATAEVDFQDIFCGVEPDMDLVAKKVRETMARVQQYELKELERSYHYNYYGILIEVLRAALPYCMDIMQKSLAYMESEVQFTVGAYMEKQQPIYIWREDR